MVFKTKETSERILRLTETSRVPRDGLLLGWGAMIPLVLLAVIGWWDGSMADSAGRAMRLWGGALLLFFAGVRRGLSFRTEGGPRPRQFAVFALLFCAGVFVLALPAPVALPLLAGAFALLAVEDVRASSHGEVPLYFRHLRPAQMTVAATSVLLCWWAAGRL